LSKENEGDLKSPECLKNTVITHHRQINLPGCRSTIIHLSLLLTFYWHDKFFLMKQQWKSHALLVVKKRHTPTLHNKEQGPNFEGILHTAIRKFGP